MRNIILLLMLYTCVSCGRSHIGAKIYIERWNNGEQIHIDRGCTNYGDAHVVEYVDTTDIVERVKKLRIIPFCPKCVSDKDADQIKVIVERTLNENVKNLYDAMKADGYDLQDESTFRKRLRCDGCFRQDVYRALVDDNYDMGDYSDFEENIGISILRK